MITRFLLLALFLPIATLAADPPRLANLSGARRADLNHDGSRIVLRMREGQIRIWNVASGELIPGDLGMESKGEYVVSPSARRILVSFEAGGSRVFDFDTAEAVSPIHPATIAGEWRPHAVFVPDETQVVILDSEKNGRCTVIDLENGKTIAAFDLAPINDDYDPSIQFSSDGRRAFILDGEALLHRYDTSNWAEIGEPMAHSFDENHAYGFGFAISEDGRYAATFNWPGENGPDGRLQLWDAETAKPLGEPLAEQNGITAGFFDQGQGQQLLILPGRSRSRVLAVPSLELRFNLPLHDVFDACEAVLSSDRQHLYTWGYDSSVRRVDAQSGKILGEVLRRGRIDRVLTRPDSSRIWVVYNDFGYYQPRDYNYVSVVDVADMRPVETVRFSSAGGFVQFSADGTRLLLFDEGRLRLFEASRMKEITLQAD
ncbi:MAG: WD40 repeat protein [Verrucomicrobiales bacterium]|jgi:WD40 repeat protein